MMIAYFVAGAILASLAAYLIYNAARKSRDAMNARYVQQQTDALAEIKVQVGKLQEEKDALLPQAVRMQAVQQSLDRSEAAVQHLQQQYSEAQLAIGTLRQQLNNAEEKLESQKRELVESGDRLKSEFENLANKILEEKTQKFTGVNQQNLKAILDPLKNDLLQFRQKVETAYGEEAKERFSLERVINRLVSETQRVSNEANNLTTALKGNAKIQGNWGEMILESLLEHSGLTRGRDYLVQEFIRDMTGNIIKDEGGRSLQPDVTICWPDQRKVIIDSKVSLIAWDLCNACADKEEQKQHLQSHTRSLRIHIDGLAKKNYPRYARALDYVLMFVPIEPALSEALNDDPQLWKYAYDKKILMVTPTTLLAVLKIVAELWRVEQQNKHALDIATKAGKMYDKFVSFLESFESVGKKIGDAQSSYDTAFKQLSTGRGDLISQVEELKKMGADADKQLPVRLLNEH